MIDIIQGILEIPEEERFIGFVGDNLHCQRQFLVHDVDDENCVYRMYLRFNDGTVNYFALDSEVLSGSTLLTWNISQEQIFTGGTVKVQIKAMADSGEIFHTNYDYFLVGDSAEYGQYFREHENSEFLQYEEKLNEILTQINSGSIELVPKSREIAGYSLQNDITTQMLYESLKVYPVLKLSTAPTTQTQGSICQLALVRSTTNGTDFKNELYICYAVNNEEYLWEKLAGDSAQTDIIDLSAYATKAYVDEVFDSIVNGNEVSY